MRILFIDDELSRFQLFKENNPNDEIWWVQNVDAAQQCILSMKFEMIFLDHDLGIRPNVDEDFPESLTIRPLIKWILEKNISHLSETHFVIHSTNPSGAKWIHETLTNKFDESRVSVKKMF